MTPREVIAKAIVDYYFSGTPTSDEQTTGMAFALAYADMILKALSDAKYTITVLKP